MKRSKASSRSSSAQTASSVSCKTKLKMTELLAIKRELTAIKIQIDGLLDCVDKMDRQRQECSECSENSNSNPSVTDSPHRGSVADREPGETSDDDTLNYQCYYPHTYHHRIQRHQFDLQDDL